MASTVTAVLLPVTQWGSGPRTAALVHGYTDDAQTWWQVAPALAAAGWRVLAPDLRGHGGAPRADHYSLPAIAADLVETLPPGLDLLIGHSLGAAVVNLAAPDLRPSRVVLVDPPWGPLPAGLARVPAVETASQVATANARWSAEDVAVEVASNGRLDARVTSWLSTDPFAEVSVVLPVPPTCPTLVVVPAADSLVPVSLRGELTALGFCFLEVPGVGHVVHRDDPGAWIGAVLSGALAAEAALPV
jgi:pimeloyl-ACP methyl ester carboxylesterase